LITRRANNDQSFKFVAADRSALLDRTDLCRIRELELQLLIGQLESSLRSGSQEGVRRTGQARRTVT
jgi:hypothetical protein